MSRQHIELLDQKTIRWNDMLFGYYSAEMQLRPCVEFIDAEEAETCLIAHHPTLLQENLLLQYCQNAHMTAT